MRTPPRRRRRRTGAAVAALLLLGVLAAGCESDAGPVPPQGSATLPADRSLTFGVFGPEPEVSAYKSLVAVFNSLYDDAQLDVEAHASREAFMGTVRETGEIPDVFLASREDLAWLQDQGLMQPVDSLLIERGIDFGDMYSRDALLAFSTDSRLQCMPVEISPMVLFYNTELVDFDRMTLRGLPVPDEDRFGWNWEAFTAAAEFASLARRGTRGIQVEPTIEGLSPFVYAGGGQVYDDPEQPTSLTFSDESTRAALETVLPVLRDPRLTLTNRQLESKSALSWFKHGKLAMVPGYRDAVPELRQVPGLQFDVISLPSIERAATVGRFTAMCLSADTGNAVAAADFLVHMTSSVSVRRIASEGYLVPANLEVALSPDFLQPGRAPDHAQVFTRQVRSIVPPPLIEDAAGLETAVSESLEVMLTAPILADLDSLTVHIDERSQSLLAPDEASESPTDES